MKTSNLFQAIPARLPEELCQELVAGDEVVVERIVSRGHTAPASGWYDQARDEWVAVLRGEAKLEFEDRSEVRLVAGDYLNIPAHTRHRVSWTAPDVDTVWLAVHYRKSYR